MTDAVTPSRSPSCVTPDSIMRIGPAIIRLAMPRHVHDGLESQLARCTDAWSEISPASATRGRRGLKEAVLLVLTAESAAGDRLKRDWTDGAYPSKDGRLDGATGFDRLTSGRAAQKCHQ